MLAYTIRRLGQSVVVMIGVVIVVFLLSHMLPGGAQALIGPQASPEVIKQFLHANGYDQPLWKQFARYASNLLHGDLGFSLSNNAPVSTLLGQALPRTGILVGLAYLVGLILAIPLGLLQGARRNKILDHLLSPLTLILYSIPQFWLGIILILYFAIKLGVLPPGAPQGGPSQFFTDPLAYALPVLTLAAGPLAVFTRFMRSSSIDALIQDYVRTARGKGVSEVAILFRHVLRNALIPIVTLIGLALPGVISGAVIVESLFNYPGMGLLFWKAAVVHDFPLLLGFSVVVAVATVAGSLLADLLYGAVDPRLRIR